MIRNAIVVHVLKHCESESQHDDCDSMCSILELDLTSHILSKNVNI